MKEFIHQICFDFIQEYMSEVKSTRIFHLDILMKYHLILENKSIKEANNYISKREKKMEFEVNWFQKWASSRLFLLLKMTIMLRVPHKIRNQEKITEMKY